MKGGQNSRACVGNDLKRDRDQTQEGSTESPKFEDAKQDPLNWTAMATQSDCSQYSVHEGEHVRSIAPRQLAYVDSNTYCDFAKKRNRNHNCHRHLICFLVLRVSTVVVPFLCLASLVLICKVTTVVSIHHRCVLSGYT